jgi:hypothetical protein
MNDLESILVSKLTKLERKFSMAYLKHLRSAKDYGHKTIAQEMHILGDLYCAYKEGIYDSDSTLVRLKREAREAIDAEHNQLSLDV